MGQVRSSEEHAIVSRVTHIFVLVVFDEALLAIGRLSSEFTQCMWMFVCGSGWVAGGGT
jgi:hypothetical protein